jgi:hypothetical protein
MMAEVLFCDCLNDDWSLVPWLSQWWLKSCSVIVSMMAVVLFRNCLIDGWCAIIETITEHALDFSHHWDNHGTRLQPSLRQSRNKTSAIIETITEHDFSHHWDNHGTSSNKQLFKKNIYQSYTVMKSYFNISFIYLLLFWEIKKLYQVFFDFPVCSFRQWKFISEWNKKNCCTNSKMTL